VRVDRLLPELRFRLVDRSRFDQAAKGPLLPVERGKHGRTDCVSTVTSPFSADFTTRC
jgi:hypothetical protein